MIACAARELFEETGVLVARGAEGLTKGQRASVLDDLTSGRMTFAELLRHYGLHLDARDFTFVGRWVTPPFSPRRFDTLFFLVRCPRKQEPRVLTAEFDAGEWTSAREALARWRRAEALAVPPVIHALRTLAGGLTEDLVERFLAVPQAHRQSDAPHRVPARLRLLPRPHADQAARHDDQLLRRRHARLRPSRPRLPLRRRAGRAPRIRRRVDKRRPRSPREIILTHLHPDHVAGANALREHLGGRVPVAAHRLTAEPLAGKVRVDRLIEDGDTHRTRRRPASRLARDAHARPHARPPLFLRRAHGRAPHGRQHRRHRLRPHRPARRRHARLLRHARTLPRPAAPLGALRRPRPRRRQPARQDRRVHHAPTGARAPHPRRRARRRAHARRRSSRASTRTCTRSCTRWPSAPCSRTSTSSKPTDSSRAGRTVLSCPCGKITGQSKQGVFTSDGTS